MPFWFFDFWIFLSLFGGIRFAHSIRKEYAYTEVDVDTNTSGLLLNHMFLHHHHHLFPQTLTHNKRETTTTATTFVTSIQENTQSAPSQQPATAREGASVPTCTETSAARAVKSVCTLSDQRSEKSTRKSARRSRNASRLWRKAKRSSAACVWTVSCRSPLQGKGSLGCWRSVITRFVYSAFVTGVAVLLSRVWMWTARWERVLYVASCLTSLSRVLSGTLLLMRRRRSLTYTRRNSGIDNFDVLTLVPFDIILCYVLIL